MPLPRGFPASQTASQTASHLRLLPPRRRLLPFPWPIRHLHDHLRGSDAFEEAPSVTAASSTAAQVSHPWPEWVTLTEFLSREGYFGGEEDPFQINGVSSSNRSNSIRTAFLNFARERDTIMRNFSSKDVRAIVECGCPSTDRKVVNSGKRLRMHLGINEGNVCSSCNLRGNCERAFVEAREDEFARTVDVMRILLTYGLDLIISTVENKPCLNITVRESVQNLLKQMVEYGTDIPISHFSKLAKNQSLMINPNIQGKDHHDDPLKPGDWHCLKCNFMNFSRNIRCLRCDNLNEEKIRQIREEQEHLPLKKGDWICDECSILNFAKNTRCFQCKAKPPKRQLNPGEWECESCNYINFRRNSICLNCDHRRPKASNVSNISWQLEGCKEINNHEGRNWADSPSSSRRQNIYRDTSNWRFVNLEKQKESLEQLSMRDKVSTFVDFPIAGGKSELSLGLKEREECKLRTTERKQSGGGGERDSGIGLRSHRFPTKPKRMEGVYEEVDDMADWFRSRDKI